MTDERALIVNADDFGLTPGVSKGILMAHERGIVTSTSVLANSRHLGDFLVPLSNAGMGIGVHLALVGEDPPLLSASEIPTVVTPTGFRRSWRELAVAVLAGRVDMAEVRAELHAQIERIATSGVALTHLDSHQHVHLIPQVAEVVFDLGASHRISRIRTPTASGTGPTAFAVRALGRRLARRARLLGFSSTAAFAGIEHSGHLTSDRLVSTIRSLDASRCASAEIGTHPGIRDDPERARFAWGFEWDAELAALCSPDVRRAVASSGFELATFADLK